MPIRRRAAIEAGASDLEPGEDGATTFYTDPAELDAVARALPQHGFAVPVGQARLPAEEPGVARRRRTRRGRGVPGGDRRRRRRAKRVRGVGGVKPPAASGESRLTNSTRPADRLELRQRLFAQSRGQRLALWGLILAPLVLVAAVVFLLYLKTGARLDPAAVLEALRAKIAADPFDAALNALMFALAVLYLMYLALAHHHERLILTPTGIEYRSPLPEALRFLRPGWSLPWSQIRTAALLATTLARGPQGAVLKLDGGRRRGAAVSVAVGGPADLPAGAAVGGAAQAAGHACTVGHRTGAR
ncbi:MAG: YebC/PmpR family DNA-binding transcriptional regulator [Desulfobacterales bacterium]|nr:YebC/PmpR family DNA-binding transcriptional regulator [Desulfobacterales bacterium]